MSSWKTATLGEVCSLIARGVAPKYIEQGGTLVLNQKCVRDHAVNYDLGRRHDGSAKRVATDRFIQIGDVLINSTGTGTLGRVAQIRTDPREPTTVDTHVTIVRPTPGGFYPDFFGYALVVLEEQLAASGEGASGQTELARTTVTKFEVSYPTDLDEQRRIVAVLDEAFAAIATATANAEKNLANARELFDRMLSDAFCNPSFGLENGRMDDTSLIQMIDGDRGSNYPSSSDFFEYEHCLFLSTKNVRPDGFKFDDLMFINREKDNKLRKGKLKRHDVVMTTRGTIGNIGYYSDGVEFENIRINSGMLIFRPNSDKIAPAFLFELLRSPIFLDQVRSRTSGAAQPQLPINTIKSFTFPFPEKLADQNAIVAEIGEISAQIKSLEAVYSGKLIALAEFKQSLLNRAFTGDLTTATTLELA